MVARDGFVVELRGDKDVVVAHVFEADVAGVAVVAGEEDVLHLRFWPNEFDESKEGDAAPAAIELAPGGDAVEIAHVFELREGVELFPGECLRILNEAADFELPFLEWNIGFNPEIEDGKAGREVLPGRETVFFGGICFCMSWTCGSTSLRGFAAHLARPAFLALDQ